LTLDSWGEAVSQKRERNFIHNKYICGHPFVISIRKAMSGSVVMTNERCHIVWGRKAKHLYIFSIPENCYEF
jgi:hypothetical protein